MSGSVRVCQYIRDPRIFYFPLSPSGSVRVHQGPSGSIRLFQELSGTLGFSICSSQSVRDCQGPSGFVSLSGTLDSIFYLFLSSCNLLSSPYCCLILWQISNKVGNLFEFQQFGEHQSQIKRMKSKKLGNFLAGFLILFVDRRTLLYQCSLSWLLFQLEKCPVFPKLWFIWQE